MTVAYDELIHSPLDGVSYPTGPQRVAPAGTGGARGTRLPARILTTTAPMGQGWFGQDHADRTGGRWVMGYILALDQGHDLEPRHRL